MTHPYTPIVAQLFEDIKFSRYEAVSATFAKYCSIDPNFEEFFMDTVKGAKKAQFRGLLHEIIYDDNTYTERTCNVLSHLCLKNQLHIMEHCINSNIEHFKVALTAKDYDANVLLDSLPYYFYIADNFNEEKFLKIDEIEKLLGINCMIHLQKGGYINHTYDLGESKMQLPRYIQFKEPVFSPYFDMLINYSENKEKYVLSKGIILPQVSQAEEILCTIMQGFHNSGGCSSKDNQFLRDGLDNYCKVQLYYEMQESLPQNTPKVKKAKV